MQPPACDGTIRRRKLGLDPFVEFTYPPHGSGRGRETAPRVYDARAIPALPAPTAVTEVRSRSFYARWHFANPVCYQRAASRVSMEPRRFTIRARFTKKSGNGSFSRRRTVIH
jgi:hypothetical protein